MTGTTPKRAYRLPIKVRFHECDALGHVNNAVDLNYLEQAAIDHATAVGWPQEALQRAFGGVFVARRHEIDYLAPAMEGHRLEVVTWAEMMDRATAIRRYVIRRVGEGEEEGVAGLEIHPDVSAFHTSGMVVTAQTRWALVRSDTMRPMRIPLRVIDDFVDKVNGSWNDDE